MATDKGFQIDVKGEAEILLPPERALLSVSLNNQGTDKAKITNSIIASARKVEELLRKVSARVDGQQAPVDYWSRTSLSESSHVPYDSDRKVNLPREYRAGVSFEARLQKFNRIGSLIHELVAIEHVDSKEVQWILTSETQQAQFAKLRDISAKNALSKAQDYASALGYTKVTPFEMKEAQAYTRSSSRKGGWMPTDGIETTSKNMAEDWEDLSEEAFHYTPEEVKMTQSVNAKFSAQ